MRIAVTGSSGLVGEQLVGSLLAEGEEVTRVVRGGPVGRPGRVRWSPSQGVVDAAGLDGHDAVIHLAGEGLFGVWTAARKRAIRESREVGTRLLAGTLARLERPPRVLLAASGVNYYGHRATDEPVDEDAPPGQGFLAEVVQLWERAADPAREAGIRVVHMRSGIVLSPRGGALAAMLPFFRYGLGGRIGAGAFHTAWVALDELPTVVRHLLETPLAGPVNVVAPQLVRHRDFVAALGAELHRPSFWRVPAALVKLLPGGMAEETILLNAPVVPRRLLESGYRFRFPELRAALRHELDRD